MKTYESYKSIALPWLCKIPSHWNFLRNKNFMSESKNMVGEEWMTHTLLSLTMSGIIPRDVSSGKGKFPKDFNTYKIVQSGDIVLCLFDIDETPRTVGLSNINGMITGAYNVFHIANINPRFLQYYYLCLDNTKALKPLYTGLRKTIKTSIFLGTKMPVPPREEQDQIVRYLDWQISKINKLIATKKKQKTLFLDYKRSIINSSMKLSNCQRRRLKTLVKEISISDSANGDFYLGMENVESWTARYIPTKSITNGNGKRFKKGDLLFGKLRPYLAKIYMPAQNGVCSGEFLVLRGYEGYLPFLKYCLLSYDFIQLVNSSTYGAKMPRTSWNFIGCCSIPHPPYSEQVKLVKSIDNRCIIIDNSIKNIDKEISLSHELRTRLISDVVTGQMDVRGIEVPDFEMVEDSEDATDESSESSEVTDE